jgi:EmrB/QacA subfamily drug resistance transporter
MSAQVESKRADLLIPMIIAVGLFMETLDSTIIAISIPQMAVSLGESALRLNLAITSYLLSLAVFIPVSGYLADRFGTRNIFCAAIGLFTVSSAFCGFADSLPQMIVARSMQGVGGAMMVPVGRLILLRAFRKDQLVKAMSIMTLPAMLGPMAGPLIGGFFTTYLSWRWIFFVNIPIGLLGMVLAFRYLEDVREPVPPRFDLAGFLLLGVGFGMASLGTVYLGRHAISSAANTAIFVVAAVALLLYWRHAQRKDKPLLNISLFQVRTFRIAVLIGGMSRMVLGAVPVLLPLMLQMGLGFDAMQAGTITVFSGAGAVLMKTTAPRILRLLGFRRMMIGNGIALGILAMGLGAFTSAMPQAIMMGYLLFFGFLRSLHFTGMNGLAYASLTPPLMSNGTSISSVAQQLFTSLGVSLTIALLEMRTSSADALTTSDFRAVFIIVGMFMCVSSLGFVMLKAWDGMRMSGYRRRRRALTLRPGTNSGK